MALDSDREIITCHVVITFVAFHLMNSVGLYDIGNFEAQYPLRCALQPVLSSTLASLHLLPFAMQRFVLCWRLTIT